jgi:hypothetical protein
MTVLLALVLLAITFGLTVGLGVGWLAILPLLAFVAVLVWGGIVFASGRTPAGAVRSRGRSRKPDLLGPGGPDDPDA